MTHRRHVFAALTAAILCAAGCESVPHGAMGGRIDPYKTTDHDRASRNAHIVTLLEACDVPAERLSLALCDIADIRDAQSKVVLELGDIYNKTNTDSTDFELIQRRLRGRLWENPSVKNTFLIVESRQRMDAEKSRVGDAAGTTARYDPALTYVLQGDFFEAVRGDRRQYYFEFKLTNIQSRKIVFLKSFDLAQLRQSR